MYKEMPADAMQPHDTWIIAFCPDTDSFFATNQRCFFWEFEESFNSEEEAITYFKKHIDYFLDINNQIMSKFLCGTSIRNETLTFLENTNLAYGIEHMEK